ncbi:hypothetical protein ASD40_16265 [Paenibacillus sp. Root444D2]|nr:hypothetical protein ASD40_16265 [Paenibacillus sp. Root444D2]
MLVFMLLAMVFIVVYGVQASIKENMGYKPFIYYPFGWGGEDSLLNFIRDYLAIIVSCRNQR